MIKCRGCTFRETINKVGYCRFCLSHPSKRIAEDVENELVAWWERIRAAIAEWVNKEHGQQLDNR